MTMNPITQSKTTITTDKVSLLAQNPANLAKFYQEMIGLTLLSESGDNYTLGTPSGHALLEIKPAQGPKNRKSAGLYHLALLLPERRDLGNVFYHLITNQVPMDGASNHGYSEAIYLPDPEGNGIEIYADKDKSEWDIDDAGLINGITEAMDSEGVLASRDPEYRPMPDGTTMGHVHLHVGEINPVLEFYHNVLGLGLKSAISSHAIFMASGEYHHHVAMNLWKGQNLVAPEAGEAGLETVFWTGTASDLETIRHNLDEISWDYETDAEGIRFIDPAGISVAIAQKA